MYKRWCHLSSVCIHVQGEMVPSVLCLYTCTRVDGPICPVFVYMYKGRWFHLSCVCIHVQGEMVPSVLFCIHVQEMMPSILCLYTCTREWSHLSCVSIYVHWEMPIVLTSWSSFQVNEECRLLKASLAEVETECQAAKEEVVTLRTKVKTLEVTIQVRAFPGHLWELSSVEVLGTWTQWGSWSENLQVLNSQMLIYQAPNVAITRPVQGLIS